MHLLLALVVSTTASAPSFARYFPFRLGDSWTYDWEVTEGDAAPRKLARTRVFDGTEFIGAGLAYRLVSDDGSYHLYTFEKETLSIHSSSEQGRLFFYDPPLVLAAPDFEPGGTRVVEHKETGRVFKTTILGREDVTVPLGTFAGALKIQLTMESPELASDSLHYFAPDVGLVAYRYDLRDARTRKSLLKIDAQLRLARLSGTPITQMEDVLKLPAVSSVDLAARDDPSARAVLKRAIENRYTWDGAFPGFRGDFEYVLDSPEPIGPGDSPELSATGVGPRRTKEDDAPRHEPQRQPPVRGSFVVARDLAVRIEAPTEEARALLRNEVSSFVSHRKDAPFDITYGGTSFRTSSKSGDGEVQIAAEGDPTGVRHTIKGDDLLKVERSVGRLRYVATYLKTIQTEGGRRIAVEYEITFFSNEDGSQVSSEHVVDSYMKAGGYWLPTGRRSLKSSRGKPTTSLELRLENVRCLE